MVERAVLADECVEAEQRRQKDDGQRRGMAPIRIRRAVKAGILCAHPIIAVSAPPRQ